MFEKDKRLFWGIYFAYVVLCIVTIAIYNQFETPKSMSKFFLGVLIYICIFSIIDMTKHYTSWRYGTYKFSKMPYKKHIKTNL